MNDYDDFLQHLAMAGFDPFVFHAQRELALQHYERCLTDSTTSYLKNFIQEQVLQNPRYVELLYEISGDLQQRLGALQDYYLETRKRVITAVWERHQVDISIFNPPNRIDDYHKIRRDQVLDYLQEQVPNFSKQEYQIVRQMLKHSITICRQLNRDVALTKNLIGILQDWMIAGCISTMRQRPFWVNGVDSAQKVQ